MNSQTNYSNDDLQLCLQLFDDKKYTEALDILLKINDWADNLGSPSAFIKWNIAICYDCIKDPLSAIPYIDLATSLDPMNLEYLRSEDIIYNNLLNSFAALITKKTSQKVVEDMYKIFVSKGRSCEKVNFQMARFYINNNNQQMAKDLLLKILNSNPNHKESINLLEFLELKALKTNTSIISLKNQ